MGTWSNVSIRDRLFLTQASGLIAYPFSTTRRVEGSLGFTRYSYYTEADLFTLDPSGRFVLDQNRESLPSSDPLNLGQASVALVGGQSFFGFTSPVRGGRYRPGGGDHRGVAELPGPPGGLPEVLLPPQGTTVAFRGMHYGRYGRDASSTGSSPSSWGIETLVRGYAQESVDPQECVGDPSCCSRGRPAPSWTRLFGSRMAVANFEFRIPVIGTEDFRAPEPAVHPVEILGFADIGMA